MIPITVPYTLKPQQKINNKQLPCAVLGRKQLFVIVFQWSPWRVNKRSVQHMNHEVTFQMLDNAVQFHPFNCSTLFKGLSLQKEERTKNWKCKKWM